MTMEYGKRITTESYHNGKLATTKTEVSVPILVTDRGETLAELLKAIELIATGETFQVTVKIDADPLTKKFKRVTIQYVV